MAELGKFDDAIIAANNGVRLAPDGEGYAKPLTARAKVHYLAGRPVEAAADIVAAWRLDPDLVTSSQKCLHIFTEAYGSIDSPSDDLSLVYRDIQNTMAATDGT